MADPIEITTRRGTTLRVSRVPAPVLARYELRFIDHHTGEQEAEEIMADDAARLVEWIGYPQEDTSALHAEVVELRLAVAEANQANDAICAELDEVQEHVRTLVDELAGAWWLKAAQAHKNLSAWLASR